MAGTISAGSAPDNLAVFDLMNIDDLDVDPAVFDGKSLSLSAHSRFEPAFRRVKCSE
jgi:hypothetical protein